MIRDGIQVGTGDPMAIHPWSVEEMKTWNSAKLGLQVTYPDVTWSCRAMKKEQRRKNMLGNRKMKPSEL